MFNGRKYSRDVIATEAMQFSTFLFSPTCIYLLYLVATFCSALYMHWNYYAIFVFLSLLTINSLFQFQIQNTSSLSVDYVIKQDSLSLQRHDKAQTLPRFLRPESSVKNFVGKLKNTFNRIVRFCPIVLNYKHQYMNYLINTWITYINFEHLGMQILTTKNLNNKDKKPLKIRYS